MRIGVYFYALATVAFGILDLVWGAFEASHQPIQALGKNIPGQQAFAYIAAVWLIMSGLAILWQRTARIGAAGSTFIYLIFVAFWLPRYYSVIHAMGWRIDVFIGLSAGLAQELLLIAPAAMVYALAASSDSVWRERAVIAARWMLGLPPIAFGLGHLVNLRVYVSFFPHWLPFAIFWIVLTGIAFLLAGSAILSGIQDVLAARLLALMMLVFEATVEIPPVFVKPHSQVAWGGAVYNVAVIGACWIFAESVAARRQADQRRISSPEHYATAHPGTATI
jgi:uncharacterized membrane protein YphA (DoxX/SURF4 family)